jgi:hypothetical protein
MLFALNPLMGTDGILTDFRLFSTDISSLTGFLIPQCYMLFALNPLMGD